jgi:hypothetical protein
VTDPEIKQAIGTDTDGFILYGSPNVLTSSYVWVKEWALAVARHDAERAAGARHPYPLVPLMVDGVRIGNLGEAAEHFSQPPPDPHNGERLDSADVAARRCLARALLRAALAKRGEDEPGRPIRVHLTTFTTPSSADADLIVDWAEAFAADSVPWPVLLAARDDLAGELARVGRPVEISVQARLGAAFAFGHAFPLKSRIAIEAIAGDDRWSTGRSEDPALVCVQDEVLEGGDASVAVVAVSFGRQPGRAVAAAVSRLGLDPGRTFGIGLVDGRATVDAATATAAAFSFGRRLRALRDEGVREAHLFLATPAPLAVLLGASISAGPAMTLYHTENGDYVQSLRLR